MALPMFLANKIATWKDSPLLFFQTKGSCDSIHYRIKSRASGTILSTIAITSPQYQSSSGIYDIYMLTLEANDITETGTFADGSTTALISLSIDGSNWSNSIPVTLLTNVPTISSYAIERSAMTGKCQLLGTLSHDTEWLDSYAITITKFDTDGDGIAETIETSAWQKPRRRNSIAYTIQAYLDAVTTYTFIIDFRTNNGYIGQWSFSTTPAQNVVHTTEELANYGITIALDEANNNVIDDVVNIAGWTVSVPETVADISFGLERSSSKTGYEQWEFMCAGSYQMQEEEVEIQPCAQDAFLDYGVGYKYRFCITFTVEDKVYTTISTPSETSLVINNDCIRLENKQGVYLQIQYNPTVNSYKYNIKEVVTPTIGGAYPVIRRVGNQKYRTCTIGGLISYYGAPDDCGLGFTDEQIEHLIDNANALEIFKERIFRESVLEFLLADDIKLLRSPIEGQMLVRLSNISLTPNTTLGRRIWEFSAQATEVAACNMTALSEAGFIADSIAIDETPSTWSRGTNAIVQLQLTWPQETRRKENGIDYA